MPRVEGSPHARSHGRPCGANCRLLRLLSTEGVGSCARVPGYLRALSAEAAPAAAAAAAGGPGGLPAPEQQQQQQQPAGGTPEPLHQLLATLDVRRPLFLCWVQA